MFQIQLRSYIICAFWKILPKSSLARKKWNKTLLSVTFWKESLRKTVVYNGHVKQQGLSELQSLKRRNKALTTA
ncbi:unnamed protein product, partial [Bubo scandiacus]